MKLKRVPIVLTTVMCLTFASAAFAQQSRIYNTVKTKLAAGR